MTSRRFMVAMAIAVLLPALAAAQAPQRWLTADARAKNFPGSLYVSGYATLTPYGGEDVSAALKRAGTQAATLAAAGIRTLIENESEVATSEVEADGNFQFVSQFNEYTRQSSNAEIAGLKTETHHDPATGDVHAFAYALRSDLVAYYGSQVDLNLKKVEDAMAQAGMAARAGQKLKAKKQCAAALEPLARAEYAQDLLTAVNPADRGGLQQQRCSQLKRELFQQLIDLEQSVYVYVQCTEDNFGTPGTLLANQLKSLLAKNQCSFCESPADANYTLTINATTRKHDVDNPNFKFTYADVQVDLYSAYKRMSVYNDEFSVKGGATTYQTAGRNALKDAAPKVWEGIKPWILEK